MKTKMKVVGMGLALLVLLPVTFILLSYSGLGFSNRSTCATLFASCKAVCSGGMAHAKADCGGSNLFPICNCDGLGVKKVKEVWVDAGQVERQKAFSHLLARLEYQPAHEMKWLMRFIPFSIENGQMELYLQQVERLHELVNKLPDEEREVVDSWVDEQREKS